MGNKKWTIHRIITGKPDIPLPDGLKGRLEGNEFIVKVPDYPHPLYYKWQEWCRETTVTDGFCL